MARKGGIPMNRHINHMDGFENEDRLQRLFLDPEVRSRLHRWADFMAVARILRPELTDGAFERRSCHRILRFAGDAVIASGLAVGKLYHSRDFNGATYTIVETGTVIGCDHFDLVGLAPSDISNHG
jgi:hypothetical protein